MFSMLMVPCVCVLLLPNCLQGCLFFAVVVLSVLFLIVICTYIYVRCCCCFSAFVCADLRVCVFAFGGVFFILNLCVCSVFCLLLLF